jgi:hypothetical protein
MIFIALAEDTMGTNLVAISPNLSGGNAFGILNRSPAPMKIKSTPSSTEIIIRSSQSVRATIIFTPIIPSVIFFAFLISLVNAFFSISL